MKKYDAIVIGFGKAGKTLAGDMAKRGYQIAIIEKSKKMYGGTCINVGCIPTKYLILEAEKQKKQREFMQGTLEEYYENTITEKDKIISGLRQKNYSMLADKENIHIYDGTASFQSNREILVEGENESFLLTADKIFINTGAETVYPTILGIQNNPYIYDSETIMNLKKFPKKLVIVGGGYIGLEYAGMFANFGAEVIILEGGNRFIPREDRDVAEAIHQGMKKQGIEILLGIKIIEIQENKVIYEREGEKRELSGEAILIAIGRKPRVKELHLENTDIKSTERGAIAVDKKLHTSVDGIWALGDVNGGPQFTYTSLDDYRIVRSELFGDSSYDLESRKLVPYTVFLDPNFSRVGLTEEEALKLGYEIKVAKMLPVTPRMRIGNQTDGYLKAIIDAKTNDILGAALYCAYSGEIINQISMAMAMGKDYTFLRDFVFTHPTASEILNDLFSSVQ